MADTPQLSDLRDRISEVDRSLLELLRRRMDLAAEVGRVKAAAGTPVVVRDVEDRVLTRARLHAEACGVSEDVMTQIFQAIMQGSVERQHRIGIETRTRRGEPVLVVGGAGGMGSWLCRFLALVGHHVAVVDPAWTDLAPEQERWASLDRVDDLDRYRAVVVAVPLARTPEVIDQITARRPRGAIVEIASIKSHLETALDAAERSGIDVCSLHPMFGPSKSPYEPLTFVLASRSDPDRERTFVETLLRHPYTDLVAIPFARHDRLMGWLLGLAHLTGMVFGSALTRSGLDRRELDACASTTFRRQAATALSILSEDPDLYLDIQRLNPHREEVYRATREALEDLIAAVEHRDREGFRATLGQARRTVAGEAP